MLCISLRLLILWEVWILNNVPSGDIIWRTVGIIHGCCMLLEIGADALMEQADVSVWADQFHFMSFEAYSKCKSFLWLIKFELDLKFRILTHRLNLC